MVQVASRTMRRTGNNARQNVAGVTVMCTALPFGRRPVTRYSSRRPPGLDAVLDVGGRDFGVVIELDAVVLGDAGTPAAERRGEGAGGGGNGRDDVLNGGGGVVDLGVFGDDL